VDRTQVLNPARSQAQIVGNNWDLPRGQTIPGQQNTRRIDKGNL
jgi:hypothetical protein